MGADESFSVMNHIENGVNWFCPITSHLQAFTCCVYPNS